MGRIAGKPWKMDKSEWLIDWENPEEVKKHSREYYRRNRDRLSKLKKDFYGEKEYGDIIRAIQREYYKANKDKKKEYQQRNRERRRRYRKEYYLKHGK